MSGVLLFGKMPSHGDFVSRGVEGSDKSSLDEWLSSEMAAARATFADEFDDRFDSAPPWHFAWRDDGWTAGALAGSIDSAGRRFPLLVARRGVESVAVNHSAQACEDAIYDAFENGWTVDELAQAVAETPPAYAEGEDPREGWWTLGSEDYPPATLAGQHPVGLLRTMLAPPAKEAA